MENPSKKRCGSDIPPDVWIQLMSRYLSIRDVINLSQVDHAFNSICRKVFDAMLSLISGNELFSIIPDNCDWVAKPQNRHSLLRLVVWKKFRQSLNYFKFTKTPNSYVFFNQTGGHRQEENGYQLYIGFVPDEERTVMLSRFEEIREYEMLDESGERSEWFEEDLSNDFKFKMIYILIDMGYVSQ